MSLHLQVMRKVEVCVRHVPQVTSPSLSDPSGADLTVAFSFFFSFSLSFFSFFFSPIKAYLLPAAL